MTFAGIDYSSQQIDIVRLNLDDDRARHDRILLDATGLLSTIDRARRIRQLMPSRWSWRDHGVVAVAIEDPRHLIVKGLAPVIRVQGALLACLPPPGNDPPVLPLTPQEWRKGCGLSGNASKPAVREFVLSIWTDPPERLTQDAADAYAIAYAARELCTQAANAA